MRRLLVAMTSAFLLLGVGGVAAEPPVRGQAAAAVSIQDDTFAPSQVEVDPGGTVTWQDAGQRDHTVTAADGSFDSGTLQSGDSFSQAFSQPGTYRYYCQFHGSARGQGMAGTVVVRGEAAGEAGSGDTGGGGEEGGGLAFTGTSLLLAIGLAVVLLGVGALALRARRRTRP
jgi:plastocyanin